jgi:G:T-mismatch repair DNA endonuclease (very short patch repair protein)
MATLPSSNAEFWNAKFETNVRRDRAKIEALLAAGWRVGVIWECATRPGLHPETAVEIAKFVREEEDTYREWPVTAAGFQPIIQSRGFVAPKTPCT